MAAGGGVAANAATPAAWMAVDKASEAACKTASGFADAVAGPPVRFSDRFLTDARIVVGTPSRPGTKATKGRLLCLYNRRTKRAEVQEANLEPLVPGAGSVKDVMWKGESIDGKPFAAGARVSLMFDTGGRVGGRSVCNNYGAAYRLDGTALAILPPMIGTMMACAPPLMDQEQQFRDILEKATRAEVDPQGKLVITASDGRTLRFSKE